MKCLCFQQQRRKFVVLHCYCFTFTLDGKSDIFLTFYFLKSLQIFLATYIECPKFSRDSVIFSFFYMKSTPLMLAILNMDFKNTDLIVKKESSWSLTACITGGCSFSSPLKETEFLIDMKSFSSSNTWRVERKGRRYNDCVIKPVSICVL